MGVMSTLNIILHFVPYDFEDGHSRRISHTDMAISFRR